MYTCTCIASSVGELVRAIDPRGGAKKLRAVKFKACSVVGRLCVLGIIMHLRCGKGGSILTSK